MIIPGAGVLVMSGKQRERGELDMLHCVVLPVLCIAKLILGGTTLLQLHLPTQLFA